MGETRYHQVVSPEFVDQGRQFLDRLAQSDFPRHLAKVAGGLALAGLTALGIAPHPGLASTNPETAVNCAPNCGDQPESSVLGATKTQEAPQITAAPTKPEVPVVAGIDPVVNERMRAMNLTTEGYMAFLHNLDLSLLSYAGGRAEFNPRTNHKPQLPTKRVILHYTAFFSNTNGPNSIPEGAPNPIGFIDFIANRFGSVLTPRASSCCGSNGYIDRTGHAYLLTPVKTRVQHNPPQDVEEFGIEVEAANMQSLQSVQYEQLAYYALAILKHENLLDLPLSDTIKGHGEERMAYLAAHPEKRNISPPKVDFSAAESELFRKYIARFLSQHPEVKQQPLPQMP